MHDNATYIDGTDTRRILVCRGQSGRLYADQSSAQYDSEPDALIATDKPQVMRHPHTDCDVEIDAE